MYVPIATLSSKDNVNLTQKLNEEFKRPVYWDECKTKIEPKNLDNVNPISLYLNASFQGVSKLYVLAFHNTDNGTKKVERNSHRKYFLPRVNITNYNVLIKGKKFL